MGGLVFAIILLIVSLIIFKVKPDDDRINPIKNTIASIMLIGSLLAIGFEAAVYNDAGYCKHDMDLFEVVGKSVKAPVQVICDHCMDSLIKDGKIKPLESTTYR